MHVGYCWLWYTLYIAPIGLSFQGDMVHWLIVQQFCFSPDHDGGSDRSGRPGWNMTYIEKCITMTTRSTLIGWSSCYKINSFLFDETSPQSDDITNTLAHKMNRSCLSWCQTLDSSSHVSSTVSPHHQHTSTHNESKLSVLMSARILPQFSSSRVYRCSYHYALVYMFSCTPV